MSFDAVQWAFSQEVLSSTQKFVLVALCDKVGDTGLSYPKMSTITRITSLHEDTVRAAIAALVEAGFIEDTGKTAGATSRVKVYRLPSEAWEIPRGYRVFNPRGTPEESPKNTPKKRGIAYNNSEQGTGTVASLVVPEKFQTPEFLEEWESWKEFRQKLKKVKDWYGLCKCQLKYLSGYEVGVAIEMLNQSRRNGWQGVFEIKSGNQINGHAPKKSLTDKLIDEEIRKMGKL